MQINSNTILKSILGSIIQFTKAIQIENRLSDISAKKIAYNTIDKCVKDTLEINKEDNFLLMLNDMCKQYTQDNQLLIILKIKEMYEKNKKI